MVFLNHLNLKFVRLDGNTSIRERQPLIDLFNTDNSVKIFLLSTRAGGMGINLTSADTVITHDLDFNPTGDLQAEDRCHRIGQKKPVTIIKMVIKDTVEENIHKMQQAKTMMNNAILNEEESESPKKKGKAKRGAGSLGGSTSSGKKEEKELIVDIIKQAISKFQETEGAEDVFGDGSS